jgi:hypothetical protein
MVEPWRLEWVRMQKWLFAGFIGLVATVVLGWMAVQLHGTALGISLVLLGTVFDLACIGRGTWIYVRVLRLRAAARSLRGTRVRKFEWLIALVLLIIPLGLSTWWYLATR